MVRLLAAVVLFSGCVVSVDLDDAVFTCETGECPEGLDCIAGVCTTEGPEPVQLGTRHALTVDHSAGLSPLLDFPLPLRIEAALAAQIAPLGADLRFTDTAGTPLPHEIESWDPAGVSTVWVKVPRIEAAAVGAQLVMLYGEPDTSDSQDAAGVWADYQAVYHLVDGSDSSPSAFDGVDGGSTASAGVVGLARRFDGTDQHVNLGTERPFARARSQMTVSAWVRLDPAIAAPGAVFATSIDSGGVTTNTSRLQLLVNDLRELEGDVRTQDGGAINAVIGPVLAVDAWMHLAFVADLEDATLTLFLDGAQVSSAVPLTTDTITADSVSTQTIIGLGEAFTVDAFFGDIDEVRLIHRVRDADWLAATVRAARDGIVTIGPAESL